MRHCILYPVLTFRHLQFLLQVCVSQPLLRFAANLTERCDVCVCVCVCLCSRATVFKPVATQFPDNVSALLGGLDFAVINVMPLSSSFSSCKRNKCRFITIQHLTITPRKSSSRPGCVSRHKH